MRRLSIIDLSGSRQPIFNEDGSKAIVFNGEIYNYQELRADLIAHGHTLRTSGDTETVLHLYEDRGAQCVTPLRGMFAFAIWDASSETLLLARDRFGIKPLYVITAPWGIAFASELKALHAAGLTSANSTGKHSTRSSNSDTSPLLGLRSWTCTSWNRTHARVAPGRRRGHAPVLAVPIAGASSPTPDPEERVREWLDGSVAAHLVSDVPVATFLSGGLDSSAVTASMALAGNTPHAFTARYSGSGATAADETGLARTLANRYGAELTVVDIRPELLNIFEPIVRALDEPHADDSAVPTWLLSQAVGVDTRLL